MLGVLRIHHMFYTSTEMGIQNFKCTDWDVVCAYASYDYLSEWTQPRYHTGLISTVTWEDLQKSNTTLRTKVTALWPSGIPCSWGIVTHLDLSPWLALIPGFDQSRSPLPQRDRVVCTLHISVNTRSFFFCALCMSNGTGLCGFMHKATYKIPLYDQICYYSFIPSVRYFNFLVGM